MINNFPFPVVEDSKHPGRYKIKTGVYRNESHETKADKSEGAKPNMTETKVDKPVEVAPTITAAQKEAMDAIAKMKAGVPSSLGYHTSQVAVEKIEPPEPAMSFEQTIINDWRTNPSIRQEFTSLASYTAFRRAKREGRTKIHRGCVVK